MTAPARVHIEHVHAGTDLAIRDTTSGWQKVHRVESHAELSSGRFYAATFCHRVFVLVQPPYPLSSGAVFGPLCLKGCWNHLAREVGAA